MEGIQGATAGPDVGNPPGDAHGSCFDSSLREASGASPLLPSISSCCGFGGANAPPCSSPQAAAWVAMGCGGSGMGASHPLPPNGDASGSKILPLEVPGELQGGLIPCPPGAGRQWGARAEPEAGWQRCRRSTGQLPKARGLTCKGLLKAHIPCQVSGSDLGSHFLGKMQ